jgi:hypothetical protein
MKYFYATITVQYDGYEWTEKAITQQMTEQAAEIVFNAWDWTHDNGIEVQDEAQIQEITKSEFDVLSKFLVVV